MRQINLTKEVAAKLGEVMLYLAESGMDEVTRDTAAAACIEIVHNRVVAKGGEGADTE